MAIEQTTLSGEISRAIKTLYAAELEAGMTPGGVVVTQLTRFIGERSTATFRKVTDKDIVKQIERGLIVDGTKPPLPLEVLIKQGKDNDRGRMKLAFKPYSDQKTKISNAAETTRVNTSISELQQLLVTESQFQGQNLEAVCTKAETLDRPLKFGCFVCLPGQWTLVEGEPKYEITQNTLTRLETEDFQFRTLELVTALEETKVPFSWDFLIADNDALEVFQPFLKSPQTLEEDIQRFNDRIAELAQLSESINVLLWSTVQKPYLDQYLKDKQRVSKSPLIAADLKNRFEGRLEFYRKYFQKIGEVPNKKLLEPLCLDVPQKNMELYAGQGPIIKKEYDCLVIGDRDPQRLGGYHSLLVPDLSIWYPYSGA